MKKKILSILVALGLMVALTPTAVFAATEGAVETTFSGNDTPTVVVECGAALTPQAEATINVTVTDSDGLADIASVVLKLYLDDDTTAAIQSEFVSMDTPEAETLAGITWNGSTFELDGEEGSSWEIGTSTVCSTPDAGDLANPFIFVIKPSKVATEAANDDPVTNWQVSALVTDDQGATGYGSDASRAAMNWYGEVSGDNSADFGIVVPGTDFAINTAGSLSMTYTANGPYDEKVKVATNAFGEDITVDVVDPWSADEGDEVAFKADVDNNITGAVGVTADGATINTDGVITDEDGTLSADNSLWLKMSATYDDVSAQSGNIYFVISDGS